ncbi:MAG: hypothetical protein K5746_02995 [Clostridiales bacterium]|nr:hypothetical protein [Clostridiales bacterium]
MRKSGFAAAMLLLLLSFGQGVCEAPAGSFRNAAVYVNGSFYDGAPFYQTGEGTLYVPLGDVSSRVGFAEPIVEDGFIVWQDFWMNEESEDFFFDGDTLYANIALLEDAGLEIRKGNLWEASILWISEPGKFEGDWAEGTRFIAHAMGAINGIDYTNSLEAFYENYANGFTVFEIDLRMSADGIPVVVHEWPQFAESVGIKPKEFSVPTLEAFKAMRILGEYTPLSFEDVARLMKQHPDMRIVTDTKSVDPGRVRTMFAALREIAKKVDPEILGRIIPQVYNNEMLDVVEEIYPWNSIIYTMYTLPYTTSIPEAFRYGYQHGVRIFTAPTNAIGTELESLVRISGCKLYLHTINDWEYYRAMVAAGHLWGVYTDTLTPFSMDGVEDWVEETP